MRPFGAMLAIALLCGYFAAQVLGGALLGVAIALRSGDEPLSAGQLADLAGPGALLGMVFGAVFLLFALRGVGGDALRERGRFGIGWVRGDAAALGIGCASGIAIAAAGAGASAWLFPPDPDMALGPLTELSTKPGAGRFYLVVIALLLAPPLEELLFRGVLLGGLTRSWGRGPAALAVTALFVGVHASELSFYWPATLGLGLLALLTLALRIRFRALGPAVAAHFAYNAALLAAAAALSAPPY